MLVILVIFLFLQGWRSVLIPALTIPVSLIGRSRSCSCGLLDQHAHAVRADLATGLVVDDAIVVVENIERQIEEET